MLLELGLFVGHLGRERTFIICGRDAELKLPSDLAGITPATFQQPESGTLQTALGAVCTQLEDAINHVGSRKFHALRIKGSPCMSSNDRWGISLNVTNRANKTLNPYTVRLLNPSSGRSYHFDTTEYSALLPDQERSHVMWMIAGGKRVTLFEGIEVCKDGRQMSDDEWKGFVLQFVLQNSKKVLYENDRFGRGIAAIIKKLLVDGLPVKHFGPEFAELSTDTAR